MTTEMKEVDFDVDSYPVLVYDSAAPTPLRRTHVTPPAPDCDIAALLEELYDVRRGIDAVRMQHADMRAAAIPPEVAARLAEIDAEVLPAIDGMQQRAAEIETRVKAAVIEAGASVKSEHLHAVWSKARTTWNTQALDGYAIAHPEIESMRKTGSPSVSIRTV